MLDELKIEKRQRCVQSVQASLKTISNEMAPTKAKELYRWTSNLAISSSPVTNNNVPMFYRCTATM